MTAEENCEIQCFLQSILMSLVMFLLSLWQKLIRFSFHIKKNLETLENLWKKILPVGMTQNILPSFFPMNLPRRRRASLTKICHEASHPTISYHSFSCRIFPLCRSAIKRNQGSERRRESIC